MNIIDIFNQKGELELQISDFQPYFSPLEFATKLRSFVEAGYGEVDWAAKKITFTATLSEVFLQRSKTTPQRNTLPYMKSDKIEINELFFE